MNVPCDTIETKQWSDRELSLRIYYQTVETNGMVRAHEREIFGDTIHGYVGLKEQAAVNTAYRERLKVSGRIVYIVGSCVFAGIFSILGILLAAHI